MRYKLILLIIVLPMILWGDTIKFGMQWLPQAQFAGYIMAYEKGFFAELGLNVELIFPDGPNANLEMVKSGELDYTTAWLAAGISANQGGELVNVCQILQRSSLMIVGRKSNGIYQIDDLNGRDVSLWGGDFTSAFNAFIEKNNLTINRMRGHVTVDLFMSGACDAVSAMNYNEYYMIYLAGMDFEEMTAFRFADDPELNFIEDGVYTSESRYLNDPLEVIKMQQAIIKGWIYTFTHFDESLEMVLKYCRERMIRTNFAEQKWGLQKILEAIFPTEEQYQNKDAAGVGILHSDDYYIVANELLKQQVIKSFVPFTQFYIGAKDE